MTSVLFRSGARVLSLLNCAEEAGQEPPWDSWELGGKRSPLGEMGAVAQSPGMGTAAPASGPHGFCPVLSWAGVETTRVNMPC